MSHLDQINFNNNPDIARYFQTIGSFSDQIRQSWQDVSLLSIPAGFRNIKNIVLAGMGGSALPGEVMKSLSAGLLRVPLEVVSEYDLPRYTNNETLVILSSYSGTTAELLNAANEASRKSNNIFVFTTGNRLAKWAKNNHWVVYQPNPIFNPSGQPRLSLGYSLTMLLALFTTLKLFPINRRTVNKLVLYLTQKDKSFRSEIPLEKNQAKQLAKIIEGKIPVLIVGPHLGGCGIAVRNMLQESSKTFAQTAQIPDLNHHMLDALSNSKFIREKFIFILINSKNYSAPIKKRFAITTEVLQKQGNQTIAVNLTGESPLFDAMGLIQLGQYISLYLALLNGVDPATILWVDYLKKRLAR